MRLIAVLFLTTVLYGAGVPPYLPPERPAAMQNRLSESAVKLRINGSDHTGGNFRINRSLDGNWLFSGLRASQREFSALAPQGSAETAEEFNAANWKLFPVPRDWYASEKGSRKKGRYFEGVYRRTFELNSEEITARRQFLQFGVIGYEGEVFVNGKFAGSHHGDFTPFRVEITQLVKPGPNMLAVRVRSDLGPFDKMFRVYGARWSNDNIRGGLWRSVSLCIEPERQIGKILLAPSQKDGKLHIRYEADAAPGDTLHFRVVSAETGRKIPYISTTIPATRQGSFELKCNDLSPWTPETPHLYYLVGALISEKKVTDLKFTRFGWREFEIRDNRFYLNQKPIYLFGENISTGNWDGLGRSAEEERKRLRSTLESFRANGYNIIRCAHMPMSEEFATIADEVGIMIYNEWGWGFNPNIDVEKFRKINMPELREFVLRDHNHPSVVMWSGANEIKIRLNYDSVKMLDEQYDLIHENDLQKRPVCNFSGNGGWSYFGEAAMKTDVLDQHSYVGTSSTAWTTWSEHATKIYDGNRRIHNLAKHPRPFIHWELVGFSWGSSYRPGFHSGDIDQYQSWVDKLQHAGWAAPRGIGFSGTIGLEAALDRKRGLRLGQAVYGKRIIEQIRQDPRAEGFAPWFLNPEQSAARNWNQPILPGIRMPGCLWPRNLFSGQSIDLQGFVANHSGEILPESTLLFEYYSESGDHRQLGTQQLSPIGIWEISRFPVKLTLAPEIPAGHGQLRLTLKTGDKVLGTNFYDIFIQSPEIERTPVECQRPLLLARAGTEMKRITGILKSLRIAFQECSAAPSLWPAGATVLLPPASKTQFAPPEHYRRWLEKGGTILVLEQPPDGLSLVPGRGLTVAPQTFADLCMPQHPVFAGLDQRNFDTWQNPDNGYIVKVMLEGFSVNTLLPRSPFQSEKTIGTILFEASIGSGRLIHSQAEALKLWMIDSAASTYLVNLLRYTASEKTTDSLLPFSMPESGFKTIPERLIPIDLSKAANSNFIDEKPDDRRGGWFDQGRNDLRDFPLGRQTVSGIPFQILDASQNGGKSILVLRGSARPYFPASATGIPLNGRFSRLYFLHTSAWTSPVECGRYRMNFRDGTFHDLILIGGRNINDWWRPGSLPEAAEGVNCKRGSGAVGSVIAQWRNPYPEKELTTLDFYSAGSQPGAPNDWVENSTAVPALLAVTGEKLPQAPYYLYNGSGNRPILPVADPKIEQPTFKIEKSLHLVAKLPAPCGKLRAGMRFSYAPDDLKSKDLRYLVMRFKTATPGIISLTLPAQNHHEVRQVTLSLTQRNREWRELRWKLDGDMGSARFPLATGNGELLLTAERNALQLVISKIYFE